MTDPSPHIGTLREKPLHASLKRWYARPGDLIEHPVGGFVIDLVRDDLLIEIQTSRVSALRAKARSLLEKGHQLRIVHPIPVEKWIVKIESDGTMLSRRRSPKRGVPADVFPELVGIPDLLAEYPLQIEILLTREEEYRRHTPGRSWRRGGWSIVERRLLEVADGRLIDGLPGLVELTPEGLPDVFTTADLAELLGRPRRVAQQMAYCLRKTGVFTVAGKRGNSVEYRKSTIEGVTT